MEVVEASISGGCDGPFSYPGGDGNEPYTRGPFGAGITLTIIVKGDCTDEGKLRRLRDELLKLVHHI